MKKHIIYFYILVVKDIEEAKRRAYTSFGKLILSEEKNNPIWSLGKANRFCKAGVEFSIPFSPGPKYPPTREDNYKYRTSQQWRIGDSIRKPLHPGEKYSYYDYPYSKKDDISSFPKKWKKIRGGSMPLEPKIKYDFRERTPGPGRYNPSLNLVRPHAFNYVIGEQIDSLTFKLLNGTGEVVGPGKYDVIKSKKTSIHRNFPKWSLGKAKRKDPFNKTWTKNETYEIYSSVADQIRTHKKSEPKINIGNSTREVEKIRGVFATTMARTPAKVTIPLPKL